MAEQKTEASALEARLCTECHNITSWSSTKWTIFPTKRTDTAKASVLYVMFRISEGAKSERNWDETQPGIWTVSLACPSSSATQVHTEPCSAYEVVVHAYHWGLILLIFPIDNWHITGMCLLLQICTNIVVSSSSLVSLCYGLWSEIALINWYSHYILSYYYSV